MRNSCLGERMRSERRRSKEKEIGKKPCLVQIRPICIQVIPISIQIILICIQVSQVKKIVSDFMVSTMVSNTVST